MIAWNEACLFQSNSCKMIPRAVFFSGDLRVFNFEQGEKFHQKIKTTGIEWTIYFKSIRILFIFSLA